MATMTIRNVTIVDEGLRPNHSVVIGHDGRIVRIASSDDAPSEAERNLDGRGMYLCPGFIDLHIHGMHDLLVDDGADSVAQLCRLLPRYGVTAWLPTVSPQAEGPDAAHLAKLARTRSSGATILGFFLEGPFLKLTGALPPEACGRPTERRIRSLQDAARPYRTVFAVAPDLEDAARFTALITADGSQVFMTHTAASVAQTQAVIDAGAKHATHFYDVFPHPKETDPGVRPCGAVEAILADPRVSVDFILDGEHVDPIAVKMTLLCKGPEKVSLITDANLGAGLPPGVYTGIGGSEVQFAYPGAPARMTDNSRQPGSLAGSGLTLDRAVRNAVKLLGVSIVDAVRMTSANPARVIGAAHERGHIREGYLADLVLLNARYEVVRTWVQGNELYASEGAS